MLHTLEGFCCLLYPSCREGELEQKLHMLKGLSSNRLRKGYYTPLTIPKRNGGERLLLAPSHGMKQIQRKVMEVLEEGPVSRYATAYRIGGSVLENALPHLNKPVVVKLDLLDFFGSIRFPQVFHAIDRALRASPQCGSHFLDDTVPDRVSSKQYNDVLSYYFACFCTLNKSLPQGAPSSPLLSNLVFEPIDRVIGGYCSRRGIAYTRYSDDMTFSGDFAPGTLIPFVRKLLQRNGFALNEEKTQILRRGVRRKITGVVVNDKPQADRQYRRKLRQECYYLKKFGLEQHLSKLSPQTEPVPYLQSLLGKLSFVLQLNPQDECFQGYLLDVKEVLLKLSQNK